MQQLILHSPQDLLDKRGANASLLLESFIPSLKAQGSIALCPHPTCSVPCSHMSRRCHLHIKPGICCKKNRDFHKTHLVKNLGAVSHFSQLFPCEGNCTNQQPQPHPAPHCHPFSSLSNMSVQPQPLPGKHQAQLD